MALALLATAIACSATGWLSVTDRFWGEAWLADLHLLLGHAFVALVPLHLLGVAAASWRQRENLLASMIHGRKQSRPDDCG